MVLTQLINAQGFRCNDDSKAVERYLVDAFLDCKSTQEDSGGKQAGFRYTCYHDFKYI